MKLISSVLITLVLLIAVSGNLLAEPLKTHVPAFNVTGSPNSQELKLTLQEILTSRLNPDLVKLVEKPDQAELLVIGSYALFGKMFSLDVLINNRRNGSLTKVYEQGEGQETVIPAMGRLAVKINSELAKSVIPAATTATAVPVVPVVPVVSAVSAVSAASTVPAASAASAVSAASRVPTANLRTNPEIPIAAPPLPSPAASQTNAKESYVIRPELSTKESQGNWSSAPLDGAFSSVAMGRTLPSGERELFIADQRSIRAYLKGSELKLVAELTVPAPGKILAIDTADLDRDGSPELYVSIIDRESPGSRVYRFDGTAFVMIAENLPWFFRGIGNDVISRKIFVQELENGDKFYGDVKELVKSNKGFEAKNNLKLPRSGNIFNFNRLKEAPDKSNYILIDEDGYLVIYTPDGSEVWKSSEKYGGSESFFKAESQKHQRTTGDLQRWKFLEQRIMLLNDGTLLVPHNEGTFSIGNNRAFNKHTLFAFGWTGAVLKEKWHTRQSPGYLADYAFDQATEEVILLQVTKKAGLFTKGTTVISINRIE